MHLSTSYVSGTVLGTEYTAVRQEPLLMEFTASDSWMINKNHTLKRGTSSLDFAMKIWISVRQVELHTDTTFCHK